MEVRCKEKVKKQDFFAKSFDLVNNGCNKKTSKQVERTSFETATGENFKLFWPVWLDPVSSNFPRFCFCDFVDSLVSSESINNAMMRREVAFSDR